MKNKWVVRNKMWKESTLDLMVNDNSTQQWERYNKKYDCRCTGTIYRGCHFFSRELCKTCAGRAQIEQSGNEWYFDCEE